MTLSSRDVKEVNTEKVRTYWGPWWLALDVYYCLGCKIVDVNPVQDI